MIHMYTVSELEEISGFTRRTIGDYIAKGLLTGPSHRGRGARYGQSDADVLRVIPRLRTLMKKEFPSLREVQDFLSQLSGHQLHSLARKSNESAFSLEVRTQRVRNSLAAILPQVAPERLDLALKHLTPEQIRGLDTGRYQLGAIVDMASLLNEQDDGQVQDRFHNGTNAFDVEPGDRSAQDKSVGKSRSSRNLNWQGGGVQNGTNDSTGMAALESITQRLEKMASGADMDLVRHESVDDSGLYAQVSTEAAATTVRLKDIAERVERLERLLEAK
jgi:DNA-binding transcriptional MerR regulator